MVLTLKGIQAQILQNKIRIHANSHEEQLQLLETTLERLSKHHMTIIQDRCTFSNLQGPHYGSFHQATGSPISLATDKIKPKERKPTSKEIKIISSKRKEKHKPVKLRTFQLQKQKNQPKLKRTTKLKINVKKSTNHYRKQKNKHKIKEKMEFKINTKKSTTYCSQNSELVITHNWAPVYNTKDLLERIL